MIGTLISASYPIYYRHTRNLCLDIKSKKLRDEDSLIINNDFGVPCIARNVGGIQTELKIIQRESFRKMLLPGKIIHMSLIYF